MYLAHPRDSLALPNHRPLQQWHYLGTVRRADLSDHRFLQLNRFNSVISTP